MKTLGYDTRQTRWTKEGARRTRQEEGAQRVNRNLATGVADLSNLSVEAELKVVIEGLTEIDNKLSSRKFHPFIGPYKTYKEDYCKRAYYKLKTKIDDIRKRDTNWTDQAHNRAYVYFDKVLEKLRGVFDETHPAYHTELYDDMISKYYERGYDKIKRIEGVFKNSTTGQKQSILSALENIIQSVRKDINKTVEKNPELTWQYSEPEYSKNLPVYAVKCAKLYLNELKTKKQELQEQYNQSRGFRGIWNRVKGFFS